MQANKLDILIDFQKKNIHAVTLEVGTYLQLNFGHACGPSDKNNFIYIALGHFQLPK